MKSLGLLVGALAASMAAVDAEWQPADLTVFQATAALASSGSCCAALARFFGRKVSFEGQRAYDASLSSYWSAHASQPRPACVISPTSKEDVSLAVFLLRLGGEVFPGACRFAVRSGGHTPFSGAANIQSGVTMDLDRLDEIALSADRRRVRIGPGNRWADVYPVLDRHNTSTPGGRHATVGVGGIITGGGISFFASRMGFVCDQVESFEVVLGSGRTVNASAAANADLWRALKGGSNNFGVVTSFTLHAVPQERFWGGFIGLDMATLPQQFAAFEAINGKLNEDPYAALFLSISWDATSKTWFSSHSLIYTKAPAVEAPPIFREIMALPRTFHTLRVSNMTDFASEMAATNQVGRRYLMVTASYRNSAEMLGAFWDIVQKTSPLARIPKSSWNLSFQTLPRIMISRSARSGGNALGLDTGSGDLMTLLLTASWDSAADDATMNAQARSVFAQAEAAAKKLGVYHPWVYLNYAAPWQDPIRGYGFEAGEALKAVSRKYDSGGVFQKNVPGGFKLGL